MSKPLPTSGFKWMKEEINNWRNVPCILEVDLEYSEDLHDLICTFRDRWVYCNIASSFLVSESRVTWATFVSILVFLDLSVLDLGSMYATDRRQTRIIA